LPSGDPRADLLPVEGPGAPPRSNGELVFEAPWQGRLFAMTVALSERGVFAWAEFQAGLIAAVARHETELDARGGDYRYYDCWLVALESLLVARGLCRPDRLAESVGALAARPAGHDHGRQPD
jgi:nitrile hydratase accessory protein